MTDFTPYQSLFGGGLIGLASVLLMLTLGRIFGATGIFEGFMQPNNRQDWAWRAAILAGMVTGPLVYLLFAGEMPTVEVPINTTTMIVGGFIVGMGVTWGSGCTSGHGVCGMARLSRRSIAATTTFMIATAITVYVIRHVIGG